MLLRKLALLLSLLLAVTPAALAAAPEQAPTPAAEERAESAFLQALLEDLSRQTADPWTQAILSEGAADVRLAGGVLSFSLRSFKPDLRDVDTAAADFRARLRARLSAHDLPCALKVSGDAETLTVSSAETKKLMKTVAKAAAAAKKAFGGKAMLAVMLQLLAEGAQAAAPDERYAPLFAAQTGAKLATAGGPHALVLSAMFADVDAFLAEGYNAARRQLAETGGAKALTAGEIARSFTQALTAQASALRKKAQNPYAFTVDIDALLADPPCLRDEAYGELLAAYAQAFETRLAWLTTAAANMPDAPARAMPANGRLSGSVKGTKIVCKNRTEGYVCYLQFRNAETDANVVTAFVANGKNITVRIPEGVYDILLAVGDLWYGELDLFGDEGEYLRMEELKILGDEYFYTLTLNTAEYERMNAQEVDRSAFR